MLPFIISRLVQSIPLFIAATILIFLLMRMIPGDPAVIYAGPMAPPESVEAVRREFGLDDSLPSQYWTWISHLLRGDMGVSYLSKAPVSELIIDRFPATLELTIAAMTITIVFGLTSGIVAAVNNGKKIDGLITSLAGVSIALPSFWLGILAIFLFAQILEWLPPGGRVSVMANPVEGLKHLFLPAVVLSTVTGAAVSRMAKSSTLEVLHEDYVRTARAKGLTSRDIILRHVLRNALVPVVTVISIQFGRLLGGAIIIESIFAWPGVGRLLLSGVNGRDYLIVQNGMVMLIFVFMVINLVTDVLYSAIDPRIRANQSGRI